jgi:hypothetical protein
MCREVCVWGKDRLSSVMLESKGVDVMRVSQVSRDEQRKESLFVDEGDEVVSVCEREGGRTRRRG